MTPTQRIFKEDYDNSSSCKLIYTSYTSVSSSSRTWFFDKYNFLVNSFLSDDRTYRFNFYTETLEHIQITCRIRKSLTNNQ